ncbi:MAG: phosphatidylglycerophosphatase A [Gammaproteobacteria bacterium]|nr:phosphatidylglycerophosphatase A [Gammaproteobacteria bacterium]MCW8958749.1 phosphatidylglycerophosphatase A [Gammaproteobacteria bacterium]MCW9089093.1 phosphatidylglycerophosphatase A [Gammaproteobacteria bacterium]
MGRSVRRLTLGDLAEPRRFLALGFGAGLAPLAPGTFGTLAAVPLYLLMQSLPAGYYLAMLLLTFLLGIWLCDVTARQLGVHDHPGIVWDEFVGYWITMFAAPAGWLWIVLGFALFRIFDVLKPWPIRWIDRRVGGGFGIMLDDVLAGVFGLAVLQLLAWWIG